MWFFFLLLKETAFPIQADVFVLVKCILPQPKLGSKEPWIMNASFRRGILCSAAAHRVPRGVKVEGRKSHLAKCTRTRCSHSFFIHSLFNLFTLFTYLSSLHFCGYSFVIIGYWFEVLLVCIHALFHHMAIFVFLHLSRKSHKDGGLDRRQMVAISHNGITWLLMSLLRRNDVIIYTLNRQFCPSLCSSDRPSYRCFAHTGPRISTSGGQRVLGHSTDECTLRFNCERQWRHLVGSYLSFLFYFTI